MQLHKLKKALWTPNNVQNIGVIDNLQPKLLPFYRDELLHSRPTDCHQVKAIGVAHIVTAPDLNLSPFAHETSSVEATKGGKFTEVYYMDISFLQLPSHIYNTPSSILNKAIRIGLYCICTVLSTDSQSIYDI